MNEEHTQLNALLARVAAGEIDALNPSEIALLESHLNDAPDAAGQLAKGRPPLMRLPEIAMPPEAAWDAMFDRIDASRGAATASPGRSPTTRPDRTHRLRRLRKTWEPLLAAAAVVLLAVMWRLSPTTPTAAEPWDLRLATDVSIDEIEVFGDATSFVAYADDGSTVIWVFED